MGIIGVDPRWGETLAGEDDLWWTSLRRKSSHSITKSRENNEKCAKNLNIFETLAKLVQLSVLPVRIK
jgi:hypothetical protein